MFTLKKSNIIQLNELKSETPSSVVVASMITEIVFFFKKYFIYLFLERGERREKERHRNIDV